MQKILRLLTQPYPCENYNSRSHFRVFLGLLGQGAFISLFLIAFKPFRIDVWMENDPNVLSYLIGFGVITLIAGCLIEFVLTPLFPTFFNVDKWNIGREILKILLLLFLIAAGNMLFLVSLGTQSFSLNAALFSISAVVLIGVFPVSFGILLNYIIQLKKYQKPVEVIKHEQNTQKLTLVAENQKDELSFEVDQILYIESADNYAVIHFNEDDKECKTIIRSSLSRLEDQTATTDIVRCHRSYIVNLNRVEKVTGNAQGYKLHLINSDAILPVARKYSSVVKYLKD